MPVLGMVFGTVVPKKVSYEGRDGASIKTWSRKPGSQQTLVLPSSPPVVHPKQTLPGLEVNFISLLWRWAAKMQATKTYMTKAQGTCQLKGPKMIPFYIYIYGHIYTNMGRNSGPKRNVSVLRICPQRPWRFIWFGWGSPRLEPPFSYHHFPKGFFVCVGRFHVKLNHWLHPFFGIMMYHL